MATPATIQHKILQPLTGTKTKRDHRIHQFTRTLVTPPRALNPSAPQPERKPIAITDSHQFTRILVTPPVS